VHRMVLRKHFLPLIAMLMLGGIWADAGELSTPETTGRYVRCGYTLQNCTDQVVPEAELWVCAPLKKTSMQRLVGLNTTPPCEERTDNRGNCLLRFTFSNVPPFAVRIVTVEATLEMNAEPEPIEADAARFLTAEPLFEFTDEAFQRLAPEFPGSSDSVPQRIFDWVREHLQDIGYDGTDRGALYALIGKKGDCTEYASLFVALCRRAGIPARAMGGYVTTQNTVLDPATYHNWAEYYLDGHWRLADPQAGLFNPRAENYVATRVLGESDSPLENHARFRCKGEGIKAVMNK
jgi:hypothetical protein